MAGAVAGAKRSVAARMPPLLNTHSPFTRASTFGDAKDLYHHPPTNRIGANYTPSAGPGYKQRAAKRAKVAAAFTLTLPWTPSAAADAAATPLEQVADDCARAYEAQLPRQVRVNANANANANPNPNPNP